MSKQSSVFYALPIEEMRGKLATKQKPIMYTGQKPNQNTLTLGYGKHDATNFVKYLVLTRRNGKNFFYAKSRTAVRNTLGTNFQRATLAVAADLADYMKPFFEDATFANVQQAFEYWGEKKTFREWLTSLAMAAISTQQEYISTPSAPDEQSGLTTELQLMKNPLFSFDTIANEIRPEGVLSGAVYTDDNRTKGLLQEYFRYYAGIMSADKKNITLVSGNTGRKYPIVLLYQTGSPSDTFAALKDTVQGAAYEATFDSSTPAIMNNFSVIDKNGVIKLTGNGVTDGAGTTITENTSIPATSEMMVTAQ